MPGSGMTWVQTEVATTTTLWTYNPSLVLLCSQAEILLSRLLWSQDKFSKGPRKSRLWAQWQASTSAPELRISLTDRQISTWRWTPPGWKRPDLVSCRCCSAGQGFSWPDSARAVSRSQTSEAFYWQRTRNVKLLQPLTLPKERSPHARLLPIAYWSCANIV